MKSFIAKRVISILVNLRYLRLKLLKYKENNKKICNTLYIMRKVSLERHYFVSDAAPWGGGGGNSAPMIFYFPCQLSGQSCP